MSNIDVIHTTYMAVLSLSVAGVVCHGCAVMRYGGKEEKHLCLDDKCIQCKCVILMIG